MLRTRALKELRFQPRVTFYDLPRGLDVQTREGGGGVLAFMCVCVAAECVSVERPADQNAPAAEKVALFVFFFSRIIGTGQLFHEISICLKL